MNGLILTEYYHLVESHDINEVNVLLKKGFRIINTYVKSNRIDEDSSEQMLYYVLGINKHNYDCIEEIHMAESSPKGWKEEYK